MGTVPDQAWESPQTRMMTYIPTVFVTPTIVVNGRVLCWNTELTPPAYADVVGSYTTVPSVYVGGSIFVNKRAHDLGANHHDARLRRCTVVLGRGSDAGRSLRMTGSLLLGESWLWDGPRPEGDDPC